jgi:hypothetical protein
VSEKWGAVHSAGVAVAIVAIGAVGYFVEDGRWAWIGAMVLILGVLVIVGIGIAGRPAGAWIDERNKMTLSRLQLIGWTVLVLSAFLVIGLQNLRAGADNPLEVAIPEVVWMAMGISTVSLVGSPLILSTKKRRKPNRDEANRTMSELVGPMVLEASDADERVLRQGGPTGPIRAFGQVEVRATPAEASWADLFRGDETGNSAFVDIGKVQMLLITVVVLLTYGVAILGLFSGGEPIEALPALDDSMLALLAVSHAGYLSVKAVSHSTPAE